MHQTQMATPAAPHVLRDDGTGRHAYSLVAVGVQGNRTQASPATQANGRATLRWESVVGADAYIVLRDGKEITGPIRIEGSEKQWNDNVRSNP
jgi:hypothetical protein